MVPIGSRTAPSGPRSTVAGGSRHNGSPTLVPPSPRPYRAHATNSAALRIPCTIPPPPSPALTQPSQSRHSSVRVRVTQSTQRSHESQWRESPPAQSHTDTLSETSDTRSTDDTRAAALGRRWASLTRVARCRSIDRLIGCWPPCVAELSGLFRDPVQPAAGDGRTRGAACRRASASAVSKPKPLLLHTIAGAVPIRGAAREPHAGP